MMLSWCMLMSLPEDQQATTRTRQALFGVDGARYRLTGAPQVGAAVWRRWSHPISRGSNTRHLSSSGLFNFVVRAEADSPRG
jgi:hypothetical protein